MKPNSTPIHTEQGAQPSQKERTLAEISVTVWLNAENATFSYRNGFLYIKHKDEEQRAFLCRQFPFEFLWEFISVLNDEQQEIGIIRRLDDFSGEAKTLLADELKRRYYAPVIEEIYQVKERYGFSYWKARTGEGDVSFTLHDTYRSIVRAGDDRIILMDVDGNRFEIPDVKALDRKSYKKIELYL